MTNQIAADSNEYVDQNDLGRVPDKSFWLVRVAAKILFCACAFLLLLFSVCLIYFFGYCVWSRLMGGNMMLPMPDVVLMPAVGLGMFISSVYILMDGAYWLKWVALTMTACGCIFAAGIFIFGLPGSHTPWKGDELRMGAGIGAYFLFLLAGVIVKASGFWKGIK